MLVMMLVCVVLVSDPLQMVERDSIRDVPYGAYQRVEEVSLRRRDTRKQAHMSTGFSRSWFATRETE